MTIQVIQVCDGCDQLRHLTWSGGTGREVQLGEPQEGGGWRLVAAGQHLCPTCIRRALNTSVAPD